MSSKLNILCAYPYLSDEILEAIARSGTNHRFLLDSGAFTAFNSGKEIKLQDYINRVKGLPTKPWRYFTLDVIGDGKKSYTNYLEMMHQGLTPAPIFTRGEDLDMLETYYQTSDYVGLGGLATGGAGTRNIYVHKMMKIIGKRKAHLLGFTPVEHLKSLRPYTCDSSSWLGALRYGACDIYLGYGKMVRLNRKELTNKPSDKIAQALQKLNVNIADLAKEESWRGGASLSGYINAKSWVQMSMDVEKNIGTKLFLAFATGNALSLLLKAHKELTHV